MRKKIPSRRRNASAQKASNSKDARFRVSARKKSKGSNDESLRIATPTESRLEFLKNEGLIAPEEIASDEDRVPLDFTGLNFKLIGAVHSRYAVRHSHAIYRAAIYRANAAYLTRDLRLAKARQRAKLSDKFKTKWALDDAVSKVAEVQELEEELLEAESSLTVVEAIAEGYEDLRNAASREMYRRGVEKAPND